MAIPSTWRRPRWSWRRWRRDRAELLKTQGGGQLLVEHDAPLTYGLDPGPIATFDAALIPLSTGFETTIR